MRNKRAVCKEAKFDKRVTLTVEDLTIPAGILDVIDECKAMAPEMNALCFVCVNKAGDAYVSSTAGDSYTLAMLLRAQHSIIEAGR